MYTVNDFENYIKFLNVANNEIEGDYIEALAISMEAFYRGIEKEVPDTWSLSDIVVTYMCNILMKLMDKDNSDRKADTQTNS